MRRLPALIERYWYSIDWDVPMLWELDLPVDTLPIAALEWHLDAPVWPDPFGREYRITPRMVIGHPEIHTSEYARIERSDLSFPLEVYRNRSRLMILDGIHRFCHAYLRGDSEVRARRVPHSAVRRLNHRIEITGYRRLMRINRKN